MSVNFGRSGLAAALILTAGLMNCAGPQEANGPGFCQYEGWAGNCKLLGVNKLREIQRFPRSFMVYEAVWEPVGQGQASTPPHTRQEITVPAVNEAELIAFLQKNSPTQCRIAPDDPVACDRGQVALALPEFVPSGSSAAQTETVSGCRKLDQTSSVGTSTATGGPKLSQVFKFDQDATTPDGASAQTVQAVVALLRANPGYSCVAVTGSTTHGESMSIARTRAQSVKQLLIQAGIDPSRLMTYGATVGVVSGGERVSRPEDRSVTLKVLLVE